MRIRKENPAEDEQDLQLIAQVSDAFAHPARIRMFRYILQCNRQMKPVCNKDLIREFGYAQATTSQHIARLTEAGLIETRKRNRSSCLYVNLGILQGYINSVRKFGDRNDK